MGLEIPYEAAEHIVLAELMDYAETIRELRAKESPKYRVLNDADNMEALKAIWVIGRNYCIHDQRPKYNLHLSLEEWLALEFKVAEEEVVEETDAEYSFWLGADG